MVTRPYFWFIENPAFPVRAVKPFNLASDTLVTTASDRETIQALYETSGQISGLAFRRQLMRRSFHPDIFTTHIYLFSDMLKQYPVLLLKDYTVAVRINESMCRHNPEIYNMSPTHSWINMFNDVFPEPSFKWVRSCGIDLMTAHCEGLIQIKNYGSFQQLLREMGIQISNRPRNLLSNKYLCYIILVLIVPKFFLIPLTEWYKTKILSKFIRCDVRVS
jgi:hypothetical protein